MKFARRETHIEREIIAPLAERIADIEKELAAEWERFIDNHQFDSVPRSQSERWAWGEIEKLPGERLQRYSRIARWITEN
jgi:hypothetical protein